MFYKNTLTSSQAVSCLGAMTSGQESAASIKAGKQKKEKGGWRTEMGGEEDNVN